jgi:L-ascorbate metabolism protein UlaG (beta-lactamase superfamily)
MRRFLRKLLLAAVGLFGGLIATGLAFGYRFSAAGYQGPVLPHFDGTTFVNEVPVRLPSFLRGLTYFWTARPGPWREWTENPAHPPPPQRVGRGELRVTFVNHATVLLQMDGLNVLTDPIWSERCSPLSWAGPRRRRAPGLAFEALPPIDLVLLSHNHYDHMDLPTLQRIAERHRPRILTGLGNGAYLEAQGISGATELDWGQRLEVAEGLEVIAQTARHFSGRGLTDRNKTLWLSFVLRGPAGAVYFAGDTGFGPHFAETGRRYGPFRLALLPIGAYRPAWFMQDLHISPAEAVAAHGALRASTSVAIHFGTFRLSEEGQDQPVQELEAALEQAGAPRPRFWVLGFGEGRPVPPAPQAAGSD